jgi:hypothetical protein
MLSVAQEGLDKDPQVLKALAQHNHLDHAPPSAPARRSRCCLLISAAVDAASTKTVANRLYEEGLAVK